MTRWTEDMRHGPGCAMWSVPGAECTCGKLDALVQDQPCRACGTFFPYDPDADYCPSCARENAGGVF